MASNEKKPQGVYGFFSWLYLQYILATGLYMLEPIERHIFNAILTLFLLMGAYSAYVFLPGHIAYLSSLFSSTAENAA